MKILLMLTISVMFFFNNIEVAYASEKPKAKASHKENCRLIPRDVAMKEAIKRANAKSSGVVVSIQLNEKGAKSEYRVRVLVDNNRIKNITIRACR